MFILSIHQILNIVLATAVVVFIAQGASRAGASPMLMVAPAESSGAGAGLVLVLMVVIAAILYVAVAR